MTEQMIDALEKLGFRRWQKGIMDRLYINARALGLELEYYNTGNIRHATLGGTEISNCMARKLQYAKTYVDVKTGELHSEHSWLRDEAQALIDSVAGA